MKGFRYSVVVTVKEFEKCKLQWVNWRTKRERCVPWCLASERKIEREMDLNATHQIVGKGKEGEEGSEEAVPACWIRWLASAHPPAHARLRISSAYSTNTKNSEEKALPYRLAELLNTTQHYECCVY